MLVFYFVTFKLLPAIIIIIIIIINIIALTLLILFRKATRDLEPFSYRGALLSTLLHANVHVFTQFA
jgi:hypothetical protein